jgi:hypothetical protein
MNDRAVSDEQETLEFSAVEDPADTGPCLDVQSLQIIDRNDGRGWRIEATTPHGTVDVFKGDLFQCLYELPRQEREWGLLEDADAKTPS